MQAIHVLHFVDHIVRQRFDTQDPQDIVRRGVAIHDVVALLDKIAFLNRNVLALGDHVFDGCQRLVYGFNRDAALVLIVFAKTHIAIGFGDDRVVFRATGFEQFRHAGKTPGDVLGLGTFARNTRHNVAGANFLTVFDGQNGVHRHRVGDRCARFRTHRFARGGIHNDHFGLKLVALGGRTPIRHDLLGHARCFIGIFAHRDARDQVFKPRHAGLFCDDRQGVGIPFEQLVATFDHLAILGVQLGTVG